MRASETVEITGHLMDSGILSRILDDIRDYGGDYVIEKFDVGHEAYDRSSARITVQAEDDASLQRLLMRLQTRGVNQIEPGEAITGVAEVDGVLPDGFYSTTNLATRVRVDGAWFDVENPEMDCGLVVDPDVPSVRTVPVSDVRAGTHLVCGAAGVRVTLPPSRGAGSGFTFMQSEVSSEKPQALVVHQIAAQMRGVREAGQKLLWVLGPAVVHTGAAPSLAALVRGGWVDVMFGGNAIATHDVEQSIYGTSLGVDLSAGSGVEHGHEHHLRAINAVRAAGSLAAAVEQGVVTGGIMHALVVGGKPFVLAGSVRDDGPLPDVHTDVLQGQRAMRAALTDVGFCIVVATMLHGVATGNVLPGHIPLVCVDINPATVTKLADRGSAQARGVVTDVGLFCAALARELTGAET